MATDTGVAVVLLIVFVLGILISVLALLTWCCRKKLHKAHNYLYIQLIVVDLLSLSLWTLFSAVNAFTGGLGIYSLCVVQGYFKDFCNVINMHTFVVLAIERLVKITKPSRHDVIFIDTVVAILLFGVWVFDIVIAMLPIIGWSSYEYFPSQFQCTSDTVNSPSHMNFLFVITYCIPILFSVGCYVAIFVRVRKMRNKLRTENGAIVMEKQKNPIGDSYSDRLKQQQQKFNLAGMKTKKPKLRTKERVFTKHGYESDSSSSSETDDVEVPCTKTKQIVSKKRQYQLAKSDMNLAKSYMLMMTIYVCLWLPYPIATYVYTYDIYDTTPEAVFAVVVCLSHFAVVCKTLAFTMHNPKFRGMFLKTMKRKSAKRVNNVEYSQINTRMSGSAISVKSERDN